MPKWNEHGQLLHKNILAINNYQLQQLSKIINNSANTIRII